MLAPPSPGWQSLRHLGNFSSLLPLQSSNASSNCDLDIVTAIHVTACALSD